MCWVLIVNRECKQIAVFCCLLSVSPNRPHRPAEGEELCDAWTKLQGSAHEDFLKETHAGVHDAGDWQLCNHLEDGDWGWHVDTWLPSNVTIRHYIGHMRGIEAYACMIHPLPDEVFAPHNPLLPTDQSEESHAPRKLSSIAQLFRAQITHWTLRKWTWFKLLPNLACLHLDVFVGDKMLKKLQNVKTKSQYQNHGGNVGPTFYFFGLGNLTSTKLVLSIDGGSFNCCCQRTTECSIVFSCPFRSGVTTVNKNAWKGQPLKMCKVQTLQLYSSPARESWFQWR